MDPETAVEIGLGWGIRHFELKTLWESKRVPIIADAQRSHLRRIGRDYGAQFVALSPGLFIGAEATSNAAVHEMQEKLPRSIDIAQELGAKLLVIFSFRRTPGVEEGWVADQLAGVVQGAQGSGLTLVIEPLAGNYCDTGQALSRIVRAVDNNSLRVNWDPANVVAAGHSDWREEYHWVKDLVAHVHLKNYRADVNKWCVFDEGDLDLKAQLGELRRDGYGGYLAIETHTRFNADFSPIIAASKHNYDVLCRWLAEDES
jgi:sugar phosphate isomerase/epimerase